MAESAGVSAVNDQEFVDCKNGLRMARFNGRAAANMVGPRPTLSFSYTKKYLTHQGETEHPKHKVEKG